VEEQPVRLAELLAALSLGIDLGFSQPMEHVLRQCRIALRLGDLVRRPSPDGVLVFQRRLGDDVRTVAVNFTDQPADVPLPGDQLVVVATDRAPSGTSYSGVVAAESAVLLRPASAGDS